MWGAPSILFRYAGATNTEDDIKIISSYCPYAPDDVGDTIENATSLSALPAAFSGSIGFSGDVDVFAIQVFRNTTVSVRISLVARSNLDAQLELLDGGGSRLAAWDNQTGLLSSTFTYGPLPRTVS